MELAGLGSIPTLRFVVLYVKCSIYYMRTIAALARAAMVVGDDIMNRFLLFGIGFI